MDNNKALELLDHIGRELRLLWGQLEVWQELFDVEQKKRQALISCTAPGFFAIVQVTLAESILMRIGRLMDPPKSGSQENSTFRSLQNALPDSQNACLRHAIKALAHEWSTNDPQTKAERSGFSRLKTLRNKWLAHNDWKQRQEQSADALGIPLTHEDFALAQRLAGRLWSIYQRACRQLRGTEVLEPQHLSQASRAATALKRLCESLYLDELLASMPDEARLSSVAGLQEFEWERMGEDRVRHVFTYGAKAS